MQRKLKVKLITAVAAITIAAVGMQTAKAQTSGSSNMVFSPYTMYGIGDLMTQGSASTMAMGGVGVGMRSTYEINYLNPASLSAISPRSALFSFGARGTNSYSKTAFSKTAYNTFDFSDVGFAVPLARGVGLSFSLMPVSAVGYKSYAIDSTSSVVENVGRAAYTYSGEGGISQVSMGLGVVVVKGFSLGANLIYYFGNIDRYNSSEIYPMLGQETIYRSVTASEKTHISHILYSLGGQYSHRVGRTNSITLGVTYQPSTNLMADRSDDQSIQYQGIIDTISSGNYKSKMTIPSKLAVGLFYVNKRMTFGLDYSRQDWNNAFTIPSDQGITLRSQDEYKFGISYAPDRSSLTSAMKRWTYKIGVHYKTSYLMKDNTQLNDLGFSVGADIPLKRGSLSKVTVGLDYGTRGTIKLGQIKETYFKIYAGVTLFGDDYWFFKQKFN